MDSEKNTRPDNEVLVRVEGVSKKFCRSLKKSLWYGLCDIAGELSPFARHGAEGMEQSAGRAAEGGSNQLVTSHKSHVTLPAAAARDEDLRDGEFYAVRDVSFELRRGECLGLIGHNGAGKTTLLKMLNGLIKPDAGRITMRGRVGALIALGAGFNPILTGRENIYINGSVLGLSKKEIDGKIDEIIDFAEIREFIDSPVQNYSSGMNVRLGFAVASTLEPDVLIIDEVLAVGDVQFRAKCYDRIEQLRSKSAIILVSHNRTDIARVCTSALLMHHGLEKCSGAVSKCLMQYEGNSAAPSSFVSSHPGFILRRVVTNKTSIQSGDSVTLHIVVESEHAVNGVSARLSIMDHSEQAVAEWRSEHHMPLLSLRKGTSSFEFTVESIRLRTGNYFCNFILSKEGMAQYLVLAFRHSDLAVLEGADGFAHYQL